MGIVNVAATGVWSNSATWPDGTLPTAADDVYANNKTVTIDIPITVLSLNTSAAGGGVAGGGFVVGGNVAIVAAVHAGTTTCLTQSGAYTSTLLGNVTGGVSGNVPGIALSAGTMTVTGTSTGGNGGTAARGISVSLGAILVLVGTSTGATAAGIYAGGNAASSVAVTGTVAGNATTAAVGLQMIGGTVLVTGAVTGSATSTAMTMATAGVSVTVVGTVTGGSGTDLYGISRAVAVPLTVDTVVSGTGIGAAGINNTSDAQVYVKGLSFGTADQSPVIGAVRFIQASGYYITGKRSDGVTPAVYIDEQLDADVPAVGNVRSGISYAHGALTGTCAVPGAASVATGVPIDNTTGTSIISMSDPAMLQLLQDVADIETAVGNITVDLTPVLADTAAILADTTILTGGAGSRAVTLQLYETATTTPIVDANVAAYNAGGDIMAQATSSAAGQVLFALADGAHTVRMRKAGVVFAVESINVSGSATHTLYGTPATIPAPISGDACTVYEYCYDQASGDPVASLTATAQIVALPYDYHGKLHNGARIAGTYDSTTGIVSWEIAQGATATIKIDDFGVYNRVTIPAAASARVADLI